MSGSVETAAARLAEALKYVARVVRVTAEEGPSGPTIVLHTKGRTVGPTTWFGYPVRVSRGPPD